MAYLSFRHKVRNTLVGAVHKGTQRMFKNLADLFLKPEEKATRDLCLSLSEKSSWTLEDAAALTAPCESYEEIMHEAEKDKERLESMKGTDIRAGLAIQANTPPATLAFATHQVVHKFQISKPAYTASHTFSPVYF